MKYKAISSHLQKKLPAIGTYLRELRFNENMTQTDVSIETGLHKNTISNAENAKNMNVLTILILCEFYGITTSELFSIIN